MRDRQQDPPDFSAADTSVVVWGLGYIGLTTTMTLLEEGVSVVGVDTNAERLRQIRAAPIALHRGIPELQLDFRQHVASGRLQLTATAPPINRRAATHVNFVCIPTEIGGRPDDAALRQVLSHIRRLPERQYAIIESTMAPRWLDRVYFAGLRFGVAPRRDWFHSAAHNVRTLTRVFAASDSETERATVPLLRLISPNVVTSSSVKAVTLTKAYENSLWFLMFAYTNCLAQELSDVDLREVLRLARTNWRTPFEIAPALNVGGYCLPLSLQYVSDGRGPAITALTHMLSTMNEYGVRITAARIAAERPRRVLILGLCYRPDVKVHTSAAGIRMAQELARHGIECAIHDPLYPAEEIVRIAGFPSATFPGDLSVADVVVTCTAQREYVEFDISVLASQREEPLVIYDGAGVWLNHQSARNVTIRTLGDRSWFDAPRPYPADEWQATASPIRARDIAVVVVDMIEDMLADVRLASQRPKLTAALVALLAFARRTGQHVIWVKQEFREDLSDAPAEQRRRGIRHSIEGTPGAQLLAELDALKNEPVFIKKRYSAFFGTGLHEYLRSARVRHLIVAGVNTHACVRMTAIDAYQHDYEVTIVEDCVASYDQQHHETTLRYLNGKIATVVRLDMIERLSPWLSPAP